MLSLCSALSDIGSIGVGKSSFVADLNFPLAHLLNDNHDKSTVSQELPYYWVSSEGLLFDLPSIWIDKKASILIHEQNISKEETFEKAKSPIQKAPANLTEKSARQHIWNTFLNLLFGSCPHRPINGMIVNFDVYELARMNEHQ